MGNAMTSRLFQRSVLLLATSLPGMSACVAGADQPDTLPEPPGGKAWRLVWRDEFDGQKLDASKWTAAPDGKRKGGWWSPRAVELDGRGHLVIRTYLDEFRPTAGCVRTKGKFEHAHGFYVARARLHRQPGHWPAFWIMGRDVDTVGDGGRDGCEIDIMEKPWLDDRVQHALHWDGYGTHHQVSERIAHVPGVMEGFHSFGLWWNADEYVFYIDGQETWRTAAGGVCQVPQYIKLSDEIGEWAGEIAKAQLPDDFLVDYVRVYDLVASPPSGQEDALPR